MQNFGRYIIIPDAIQWLPSSILKHQAKSLWGAIADRQGDKEWTWPSIKTLAFEAAIASGEVTKYLDRLVELELIERGPGKTTNCYRVKVPGVLLHAAADIKALPTGNGFNVAEAKRIFQKATTEWMASLGHHETIKLSLAGTPASEGDFSDAGIPASEMPESRQPRCRNSGVSDAGIPATNHSKSSPINLPRSSLAPATPPHASGGISPGAPLGGQSPEAKAKSQNYTTVENMITALRGGLPDHRRADQWEKLADELHSGGATPKLIQNACRVAQQSHQPLKASTIAKRWRDFAYHPGVLDDAGKIAACSSHDRMRRYLQFGKDAAISDGPGNYAPSDLNWTLAPGYTAPGKTAEQAGPESWTVQHFMGYYWFLVSWYRSQRQFDLSLPDFGRLAAEITKYLQNKSKTELWNYIRQLAMFFDVVRFQLRNSTTVTVALNEFTLNNTITADKMLAFNHLPPEEQKALIQQANEWATPGETDAA